MKGKFVLSILSVAFIAANVAAMSDAMAAPPGFTILIPQEQSIKPGMTQADVKNILGKPSRAWKYGKQHRTTWDYDVVGKEQTVFQVQFDAGSKVLNAGEWVYPHSFDSNPAF
jgi:outer membrane protein assembly factor BamE (lipoprotein component of BamABCDE complex)